MAERLTRSVVVDHAARLADREGLDGLTVAAVARSLGITAPGVYRHVTDLADLRAAVGERGALEVADTLSTACAGLAGREAIGALAGALRAWAREHPGRYAALQVPPRPGDRQGAGGRQGVGDRERSGGRVVLAVMANVLRAYHLGDEDLTDAIRFLRSTLHGFIDLERVGGYQQARDIEVTLARVLDALDAAFRSWGSPGGRVA